MRDLPEHYRLQFESCTKIAVKREAVRLTGLQKEQLEQEEIRAMWIELTKEMSK